jgi:dipeptidase E
MSRKIVAIGGGENGRTNSKGEQKPYETKEIDEEIVKLSNKEKPNLLFLAHSQIPFGEEAEKNYYNVIKKIYENLGCNTKWLKVSELKEDLNKAKEYVEWADIIYEGGGATELMLNLWKETGFDNVLKNAYESGKVMCGISAGAICWFNSGYTDDPKLDNVKINRIYGLDLIDAYFSPHCQKEGKLDKVRNSLKYIDKVGILLSNCAAIEIIDNKYRIIKTKPIEEIFEPFAYKTYWENDQLVEEEIDVSKELKSISELISKN